MSFISSLSDNLSALYTHYQIDPQIYPPPDLQLYKTIESSFHSSHLYLQPSRLQNSSLSEQQRNSSNNDTRSWRKTQKRLRYNRNRKKKNNTQPKTSNNFHYHNMITVRQISCHDMLHSQMMMKKELKYKQNNLKNKKIKNEYNKKIRSANPIENKSQKYKNFPNQFKSSLIQSTMNKSLVSLTTPISNSLFQQQELRKKMSDSMSKVTSLRDSSTSSLVSTQLLTDAYNQTKPNVFITSTTPPGSQIDLGLIDDNSSIIPHFSSTIAMSNVSKIETAVAPTSNNEDIQDLVEQLKTSIATLSLLLQNKTEHEKHIILNVKSYSDEKTSRTKKKLSQSSSLSLTSTPNPLIFSKKSISHENNLILEDIAVRRCNSFNNQRRKKYQSNIPSSCIDQHQELKRCLLICCRGRTNKDRSRNINSNERQRNSNCTWYDLTSNEHLLLSQSSQLMPNNNIDIISVSKSTLILSEDDDEYELRNKLSRVSFL